MTVDPGPWPATSAPCPRPLAPVRRIGNPSYGKRSRTCAAGSGDGHPIGWLKREELLDLANLGFDILFAADLGGDSRAEQLGKLFAGPL